MTKRTVANNFFILHFLRIQRCGYFADSMAFSKTYGFGNRSCVGYNSVKF